MDNQPITTSHWLDACGRLAEVQTEHHNEEEIRFKWLWMWWRWLLVVDRPQCWVLTLAARDTEEAPAGSRNDTGTLFSCKFSSGSWFYAPLLGEQSVIWVVQVKLGACLVQITNWQFLEIWVWIRHGVLLVFFLVFPKQDQVSFGISEALRNNVLYRWNTPTRIYPWRVGTPAFFKSLHQPHMLELVVFPALIIIIIFLYNRSDNKVASPFCRVGFTTSLESLTNICIELHYKQF